MSTESEWVSLAPIWAPLCACNVRGCPDYAVHMAAQPVKLPRQFTQRKRSGKGHRRG